MEIGILGCFNFTEGCIKGLNGSDKNSLGVVLYGGEEIEGVEILNILFNMRGGGGGREGSWEGIQLHMWKIAGGKGT